MTHIEQNTSSPDNNYDLLKLNINQIWHRIATSITNAANKHIPNSISTNRKHHTHSLLATKLHTALQLTGSTIRSLTTSNNHDLNKINTKLNKVNKLENLEIQILTPTNLLPNQLTQTITTLKQYHNTLYKARNLENYHAITENI